MDDTSSGVFARAGAGAAKNAMVTTVIMPVKVLISLRCLIACRDVNRVSGHSKWVGSQQTSVGHLNVNTYSVKALK